MAGATAAPVALATLRLVPVVIREALGVGPGSFFCKIQNHTPPNKKSPLVLDG